MNSEEHDDLWRLLGKIKEPVVSPYFSRNVLRTIRNEESSRGFLHWLQRRWKFAVVGVSALILVSIGTWQVAREDAQITEIAREVSASPDYTVIANLDELLAYEENDVWLENVTY